MAAIQVLRRSASQAGQSESQLQDAREEMARLQNELAKENMLRKKMSEVSRKHIGELEAKLADTNEDLRRALVQPPAPSAPVAPRQAVPQPKQATSGKSASNRREREQLELEALKEAARDIKGKMKRVEVLKQEV